MGSLAGSFLYGSRTHLTSGELQTGSSEVPQESALLTIRERYGKRLKSTARGRPEVR